jgi:hypothetical protein
MHFLVFYKTILPIKRYKIALTTFWKKNWWKTSVFLNWFDSNFDFKKIWEKKIVFESSVLAWIRIRIESIQIHHPGYFLGSFLYSKDIVYSVHLCN